MKKVLLLGFLILLTGCATIPIITYPPESRIISVDSNKAELFKRSMIWMAKTFRSAKAVIEYQDKEYGVIVGNGYSLISLEPLDEWGYIENYKMSYTLIIEAQDNRVRIIMDNIDFTKPIEGQTKTSWFDTYEKVEYALYIRKIKSMFDDLEKDLKAIKW